MTVPGGSSESAPIAVDSAGLGRLLAVLAVGVVPWTVVVGTDLTLVFPFGLVSDDPWFLVSATDYLRLTPGGRAAHIDAWLIGAALYGVAVGLAALGALTGVEDPRLTGGLLVCAAVSQFPLAAGFTRRVGYVALPVGSLLLLGVAWWWYWPAIRRSACR